jgi:hypothetical protein
MNAMIQKLCFLVNDLLKPFGVCMTVTYVGDPMKRERLRIRGIGFMRRPKPHEFR